MRQSTRLRFFILLSLLNAITTQASELWGEGGMEAFCNQLQTTTEQELASSLKEYLPVIMQEDMNSHLIKTVTLNDALPMLALATQLGWEPLELFSDAEFANKKNCTLLFDKQTLRDINGKFNIHGIWMISAQDERNQNIAMDFILIGQGKLIIGYPQKAIVKVADYNLFTGKYTYEPIISMDIINDGKARGLFNIKTLHNVNNKWAAFKGPLGASIQSGEVDNEHIRVQYFKVIPMVTRIQKISLSKR